MKFKKGSIPWNKGLKGVQIAWNKGKKFPEYSGENNSNWKGDKVGKQALHNWVKRRLIKPKQCQRCGIIPKNHKNGRSGLDLSNNSGKYKRDLSDWEWLCRSCHWFKDGTGKWNKGENHNWAKLSDKQIKQIQKLYKTNKFTQIFLANKFKINQSHISRIINKKVRN